MQKIVTNNSYFILVKEGEKLDVDHPCAHDVVPKNFRRFFDESMIAVRDALVVGGWVSDGVVDCVDHVRGVREGAGIPFFYEDADQPHKKPYGYLRNALRREIKVEPNLQARNGLRNALVYKDETLIPAYSRSGTFGWLLSQQDIRDIKKAVPPLRSGKTIRVGAVIDGFDTGSPNSRTRAYMAFVKIRYFPLGESVEERGDESWRGEYRRRTFEFALNGGTGEVLAVAPLDGKPLIEEGSGLPDTNPFSRICFYKRRPGDRIPGYELKEVRAVLQM